MTVDFQEHVVLYVDDERNNLVVFRHTFEGCFKVRTAQGADEALAVMESEPVAVLLTDQRMPNTSGVELCERIEARWPDTIRMIVSAYLDVAAAVAAINRGHVHRFIEKPWKRDVLLAALREGIERFALRAELVALQASLVRQERLATLGLLAAGLTHDLQGPISSILGALAISSEVLGEAARKLPEDEALQAELVHLGEALREAKQAETQLRLMLDSTRDLGLVRPRLLVDVAVQAERALGLCRSTAGHLATVRLDVKARPSVLGDPGQLAQVVVNLVVNAAQAMERAKSSGRAITVRVAETDTQALLEVEDDGPGIPPEVLSRVFEPFFTTRADSGGSGLGLAMVKRAVEALGGTVTVTSQPAKGARFTLLVPKAS